MGFASQTTSKAANEAWATAIDPYHTAAMLKKLCFRTASLGFTEFIARLAAQKQSFLFS